LNNQSSTSYELLCINDVNKYLFYKPIGEVMKLSKLVAATTLAFGVAAAAQAQSSVTLYGLVDAGIGYTNVTGQNISPNSELGVTSGVSRPTVFGIRGVEQLGNDTAIVFNLASQFSVADGRVSSENFFGQQSTLGIRNTKYGQVDLGLQTNMASKIFQTIDPFSTFYGQAGMGASFGTTSNLRYGSMVMYQTPTWNGLSAGVGYSFNTSLPGAYVDNGVATGSTTNYGTMSNPRALTLGVNYANGPLQIAASYDQVMPASNIGPNANSTPKAWLIGGAYDFKVVKASLAYGQTRSGAISGTLPSQLSGVDKNWAQGGVLYQDGFGANSYLVGLSAPIGSDSRVMGSIQWATPTGSAKIDQRATQSVYSVGYEYDFSKRTTAYAYVSYANDYLMSSGVKSTALGVGMRHAF
jgi:GBP family porin